MTEFDCVDLDSIPLLEKVLNKDDNALEEWERQAYAKKINEEETKKIQELCVSNSPQKNVALYLRARIYVNNHIRKQNNVPTQIYEEANRLYDQAIELGNTHAMNRRAFMYEKGLGCERSYYEAVKLYKKAIKLEDERGIESNHKTAIKANLHSAENALKDDIKIHLDQYKNEFQGVLNRLKKIKDSLNEKDLTKKKYNLVIEGITDLSDTLEVVMGYFFKEPTQLQFQKCKKICLREIGDAKIKFGQYRECWFAINPIIRKILGILASITVLPALITFAKAKHGYVHTFFKTPETAISKEIDEVRQDFDGMSTGISSFIRLNME
jgi:hypothetical protein